MKKFVSFFGKVWWVFPDTLVSFLIPEPIVSSLLGVIRPYITQYTCDIVDTDRQKSYPYKKKLHVFLEMKYIKLRILVDKGQGHVYI